MSERELSASTTCAHCPAQYQLLVWALSAAQSCRLGRRQVVLVRWTGVVPPTRFSRHFTDSPRRATSSPCSLASVTFVFGLRGASLCDHQLHRRVLCPRAVGREQAQSLFRHSGRWLLSELSAIASENSSLFNDPARTDEDRGVAKLHLRSPPWRGDGLSLGRVTSGCHPACRDAVIRGSRQIDAIGFVQDRFYRPDTAMPGDGAWAASGLCLAVGRHRLQRHRAPASRSPVRRCPTLHVAVVVLARGQ